ncbi:MAG: acyl-ACP--UDP-N-acetylglucosamine O-acyltransferase [Gammaproteobacteria bacterium]|uniref:Acyl-[acyl-carrier-protein]--UDP-N-acetylglucosamine O-acyltransferase n=1 Tax=Candidatus Thiopontia autotrophica TaxID=2841688 RepID=A0A8J6PBI0_9GAMM|nr:acyl-ACP--UDP-N-acetylglucosamine O-acyltransferase [Candidatus Thiopontia autotrophica]MBL6968914.1 acyl-ACP--UDP-N-acetylglucosamine O-acyltransferase [Gammaproteobacteria bacterium]
MIHPTAIIDESAIIADRVEVGPYSVIGPDVAIGAGTKVESHVVIKGPTTIGENNHFFQFSSIGEDPQDLKYHGEPTLLEIGDNNTFRECCTVNRGTVGGGGVTRIGDHNLIMAYVHIAHDCIINNHVILVNNASLAGHVVIHDHVILGGFTLVSQFITIGSYAFSTMGSAINKNIPPYILVSGNLARPVSLNLIGLKRKGFDSEARKAMKQAFKMMFHSHDSLSEVISDIGELSYQHQELAIFHDFIKEHSESKNGVIR